MVLRGGLRGGLMLVITFIGVRFEGGLMMDGFERMLLFDRGEEWVLRVSIHEINYYFRK